VAALVFILLAWLPAYRWFFLVSLGIGIMVAAILYFWNKHRPVKKKTSKTSVHWDCNKRGPGKRSGPLARYRAGGTPALPMLHLQLRR
jgi:hypothetical protein